MKRLLILSLSFFLLTAFAPAHSEQSEILSVRGEIFRFYETHANDWTSYVEMRDSFNKKITLYVHPKLTVVHRGGQIEDVGQLTGGMKVTILYRVEKDGNLHASVIQINGVIRV